MTKREIFDKIIETTAEVCNVEVEEIIKKCKREDVCYARALCVFWCDAAGFTVETMVRFCECKNANSINSIKARLEGMWKDKCSFHILCSEIGNRLLAYARSIGEDFDVYQPLRRMSKITGKY